MQYMNEKILKKKIKIIHFNTVEDQCNDIVEIIKNKIKYENIKLDSIAIIARNNFSLQSLESLLAKQNIPCIFLDSISDNIIINNKIILSTIHGTKGLEFKNVFIIDLNSNIFPSTLCDDIEEERRLFYVAITRTKRNLILCYTRNNPSSFLFEILNDIRSRDIIQDYLNINIDNILISNKKRKIYNIIELIRRLEKEDYDDIKNIFDYRKWEITEVKINTEMNNTILNRDLILSNIDVIYNDFIRTYIYRSILQYNKKEIECLDYIFISLYDIKNNLKILNELIGKTWIDKKYGTRFLNYDSEYITNIINYIDSNDIKNKIDDINIDKYKKAYINYTSSQSSNKIIFDIFIISTCASILKGRKSLQYLINFNEEYNIKQINIKDFDSIKKCFDNIYIACSQFVSSNILEIQLHLRDKQTKLKCIIDLLVDDSIIEIKPNHDLLPNVETVIKLLCLVAISRNSGYIINYIKLYNPLKGIILIWDIKLWDKHNEILNILLRHI